MKSLHPLAGIYAAAITPLNADQTAALAEIPEYLNFLASRGCHGALILGTTGEGTSFSIAEREQILRAALEIRAAQPQFRLLAGTGTPSLTETIQITKFAFDLGYDGAVTLPPYYYHQATDEGIFEWYAQLLRQAVPSDAFLLGYHFPAQSGMPIPQKALRKLRENYPNRFIGIKDSTASSEYTRLIGTQFDQQFVALVGNDTNLQDSLAWGGSGCITALANLYSPQLRQIWDAHQNNEIDSSSQAYINAKRAAITPYLPFPAAIKALVSKMFGLPFWPVKLPLASLSAEAAEQAYQALQ